MKTLLITTLLALSAGAVITRPETKDFITVRRVAYDPNGTEIVLYERDIEADITQYLPGSFKAARQAALDMNDANLLQILILQLQADLDDMKGGER